VTLVVVAIIFGIQGTLFDRICAFGGQLLGLFECFEASSGDVSMGISTLSLLIASSQEKGGILSTFTVADEDGSTLGISGEILSILASLGGELACLENSRVWLMDCVWSSRGIFLLSSRGVLSSSLKSSFWMQS
jgi:hypothetical protein